MKITDLISVPLGALLGWCNTFCGNEIAAILVFTLLTMVYISGSLPVPENNKDN